MKRMYLDIEKMLFDNFFNGRVNTDECLVEAIPIEWIVNYCDEAYKKGDITLNEHFKWFEMIERWRKTQDVGTSEL